LGLEAQRGAILTFAKTEGFEVVRAYTEVETGKGSDALDRIFSRGGGLADAPANSGRRQRSQRAQVTITPSLSLASWQRFEPG
jgi:hypothetical protein